MDWGQTKNSLSVKTLLFGTSVLILILIKEFFSQKTRKNGSVRDST